jgi:hypothetical protein
MTDSQAREAALTVYLAIQFSTTENQPDGVMRIVRSLTRNPDEYIAAGLAWLREHGYVSPAPEMQILKPLVGGPLGDP